jgi:hypothetical protein
LRLRLTAKTTDRYPPNRQLNRQLNRYQSNRQLNRQLNRYQPNKALTADISASPAVSVRSTRGPNRTACTPA